MPQWPALNRDANFSKVRRIVLMLVGLTLVTLAVYWQVHRFDFVNYDDADYVYDNRYLRAGFTPKTIHWALTTYCMGNWNPLLWFSFLVDGTLFHLRPGPMHLENVLLHLITGLLLWRLLFVSTGKINRSFVVAAIFLCHPMHVESVAWISERKDVLSTPILLAAMLAYVRYCKNPDDKNRWLAYAAMLLLFAISLLVKTMGVTLPAVLLLMDYWPLGRWTDRSWIWLIVEKIPVLAISIGGSVMAGIAQVVIGAAAPLSGLGIMDRIDNAIVCYGIYIAKLVVPINLGVFYPHPASRPLAAVIASGFLLLMTTVLFYRLRRRFPYAIVGWLFFLGTLLPVIGLVQVGGQAMADRYSYFPSIGLFIMVVWGCADFLPRFIQSALALAIIGLFAGLAHKQASYWRDSEALFTHTLDVADDSAVAHVVLAQVAVQKHDIHGAVDQSNLALRHGPNALAYEALGDCWLLDDPLRASGYYKRATEIEPRAVLYHSSYAEALRRVSELPETRKDPVELKKDLDLAKQQVQAALKLDPQDPKSLDELGRLNVEVSK